MPGAEGGNGSGGGNRLQKVRRELFVIIEVFYVIIMVKVALFYTVSKLIACAFGISEFQQNINEYSKINNMLKSYRMFTANLL